MYKYNSFRYFLEVISKEFPGQTIPKLLECTGHCIQPKKSNAFAVRKLFAQTSHLPKRISHSGLGLGTAACPFSPRNRLQRVRPTQWRWIWHVQATINKGRSLTSLPNSYINVPGEESWTLHDHDNDFKRINRGLHISLLNPVVAVTK